MALTTNQQSQQDTGREQAQVSTCRVRSSVDITCPANTVTLVVWDTTDYAPTGMHATGRPSDIQILESGVYEFRPLSQIGTPNGFFVVYALLKQDGSTVEINRVPLEDISENEPFDYLLDAGQVVQVSYDNQSGSVRTVQAVANSHPRLVVELKYTQSGAR